ncbi:PREDICTED: laminin subunit alpha-5 [Elephantulus edwardii]|uniref:laminin subunit alpha-5 n=1 Tax=Elephantulus edwardii TaxID=28737 RepID=UPI0003F09460|nr:PREDICTED: laminin subunit alpha-5 [Elephantulus edwardii]
MPVQLREDSGIQDLSLWPLATKSDVSPTVRWDGPPDQIGPQRLCPAGRRPAFWLRPGARATGGARLPRGARSWGNKGDGRRPGLSRRPAEDRSAEDRVEDRGLRTRASRAQRAAPTAPLPGDLSLHPPYFNLAESSRIAASATCGEEAPARGAPRPTEDLYCKLVGGPVAGGDPNQTIQGQYCDICTAAHSNKAHPASNAIDGTERWWQSPPLSRGLEYNQVNITLDLGQVFHVAYVLIKFANSPRPDLWVLERSTDFGRTYQPWQYFASSERDCLEQFGPRTLDRITKDDDVICTTEYSRIVPLENGEVVVSLVNGRPGAMNFSYSPLLRDFTKATNIRLRFLRTNTLLGHLMGKALRDPTVTRRYYYSIKDISVGGRCVCHGHADVCDAKDPTDPYRLQCACQHNTCGGSCDQCCPGFHQRPWRPATTNSANECQSCNCHGHASDCYYDPEVDRQNASQNQDHVYQGGGVCIDCQHHTTGINCERCLPGFYRSPDHPLDSPRACRPCDCESDFTDGTCEDLTGRCYCRPNFTGERCNTCAEGFAGFPQCYREPLSPNNTGAQMLPAGQIINCDCSAAGTVGNACRRDPQLGRCVCKPNFQGAHCESCAPGFYGPGCQACQCSSPGAADSDCDPDSGQCRCRPGFMGVACERCAPGYFHFPLCQLCGCSPEGTLPEGCDEAGRCLCRPEFEGPHCDRCRAGYHGYPRCHACACDPRGSLDQLCGAGGMCQCRPGYAGPTCQTCSPGFHGFPTCVSCQCSAEGSLHAACDPRSGQCSCRPHVTGLRCDMCVSGTYDFPHCKAGSCHPAGLAPADPSLPKTHLSCVCRAHVEGPSCDRCKSGFWGLSPDIPEGCTRCSCDPRGTLGGVSECHQGSGQCFCRPHVCGQACAACRDGFFGLDQAHYFGCRGCHCDVGGALGQGCEPRTGACVCRPNTRGSTCNEPAQDHYLADLHHLRLELEEAATPEGHAVRFGFNPLEFENFSWRGYAQMAPIQPRITARLNVTSPDLFRLVFRYVNRGSASVSGRVSVWEEGKPDTCANCTEQSQGVVFPPSTEPAFVMVPQRGFGEPFVMNPGTWALLVEAEGVLLDYVVLLPSTYYEAALLQLPVTEACTYHPTAQPSSDNCLLYVHLPLNGFPTATGQDALCRQDNSLPRPCPLEQLSPSHPLLAACLGSDVDVQLQVAVPGPGLYMLVVEYANEEAHQEVGVAVHSPQRAPQQGMLTLYPCSYSTLCRGTVVDTQHRLAVFHLDTEASIRLTAEQARFFLHGVTLVPAEKSSMEFVEPQVHCISRHGTFGPKSAACLPSRFPKPPQPIILRDCQVLPLPPSLPLTHSQELTPGTPPAGPRLRPPTAVDPDAEPTLLRHPQGTVVFTTHVPALGRYAFLLHGYQPSHPTFPVEVLVSGGRIWHGQANASFCPHGYGCRILVVCEGQTVLDVTDSELTVTVRVPEERWFWLDYVLVVPEDVYTSRYLQEEPLDKSYDFINHCAAQGYHISPSSSPFCRKAAISLSLFYNNGAQPCGCHEVGAVGPTCEPYGGQCPCRAHVIGRDCSRCATGYWGFPHCRPCDCGARLCDEVTGQCICPPRTLQPDCLRCQPQTFGCHPLVGCEECNCSGPGVQELTEPSCDVDSGQCRCRPNVVGRRCDTCAPGFHGYPACLPCDCDEAGTAPGVCDPLTGQCHCKENVQGPRCDQCRVGTFSLDAANPKGCTSCFCFGATDRCDSSPHGRREFVDMEGWTLLSGDRQVVPHERRAGTDLLHADLRQGPETPLDMYWQAPPSYLGDHVSSYGGMLRYELRSETQRGDVFVPTESRPDVVLQGNQMSIIFLGPTYPPPGHPYHGHLQLVEGNFRHLETHNTVSREELMMVLAGLEQLQIRALFSQISSAISLHRVVLEVATIGGRGPPASSVELCMCPANYGGDSCQECAPGYYRDTKGLFLGRCVPCQCHGHSDRCLPGSGICVGCQHNTEGDHCERCQPGFMSSGPGGPEAVCTSCPCPLAVPSNNFAVGCVLRGGRTYCLCKPGYAGPSCERCAPGFFGNPLVLGSSCRACDCSGNGDPNMLFNDCDPLTGACRGCMRHTTGPRCEICAPGYYGNALLPGNCSRCDCSPCGTEACDPHTGQCLCKAGVAGRRCDHCQEGHYGFQDCAGCRPCSCGPAAKGSGCHPQSGQCHCQPGAGGPQCRECAPGHWGVPEQGCQRCQCRGGHCDPHTGRCSCPSGLSGERCDACSQQYQVPVLGGPGSHGVHCEVCDHCVVLLLDDLEQASALLPAIREQLRGVNASSAAWARLYHLNASIAALKDQLLTPLGPHQEVSQQLETLEQQSESLSQDTQHLNSQARGARGQADMLVSSTEATRDRAQALLTTIRAMAARLSELGAQTDLFPTNASAPSGEQLRQTLAEVQRLLAEMRARDLSTPRVVAEAELDEAQRLLTRVREQLASHWEENQALAQLTREQLSQHEAGLMDLREALNRAVATTLEAEGLNSRNQDRLEEALQRKQDLSHDNATLQATLQAARDTLALASGLLRGIDEAKEEYERLAASLDGAQTPLFEKIRAFSPASSKVDLVVAAEAHAQRLDQLAHNLSSIIRGVNQDRVIQRAIEASNAYSSILQAVQAAEEAAGQALLEARHAWETVVQQGLRARAQQLLAKSRDLEEMGHQQQARLKSVLDSLQPTGTKLRDAQAQKDRLAAQIRDLQAMLAMDTGTSEKIAHAKTVATEAQETAARILAKVQDMQKNVEQWQGQYADLRGQDLNEAMQDAGRSVSTLEHTVPQLLAKLNLLEGRGSHNASLALSANIARVRQLIAQARGAANKVKVPMKFNGRSGVQVRTPRDLADLAAYTSLKFYLQSPEPEPGQPAGDYFVLYMGSHQASGDYMGVALRDQKLHWVYRLGEADPTTLSVDEDIGEEFAAVSIDRTLQFGHMSITVEKQMVHETKGDAKAPGHEGLLSLRPTDFVFYVGGYPRNFTPPEPLNFPGYRGCIEVGTLNEEVLSLYNFERTFQLDTAIDKPCPRSKSTGDPWLTDGSYLDGTGYARISFESQMSNTKRFDQELRLVSYSGVLFFLQHQDQFLCLAVRERHPVLLYDFGKGLREATPMQRPTPTLTADSKAVQVFLLGGARKRVLVRVERTTVFSLEEENMLEQADTYFLGGVPPHLLPSSLRQLFPSGGSIRGCVKGIKALGKYVDLKRLNTTGISAGCTADLLMERAVSFHGHGFMTLELADVGPLPGHIYSGFGFRTTQSEGLLFSRAVQDEQCQVCLQEGHIVLWLLETKVKTWGRFDDGAPHYVAFYSNATGVWIYVDDQLQQTSAHQQPCLRTAAESPQLFLGGSDKSADVHNFSGCISNVFVEQLQGPQRVLNLQHSTAAHNVTAGCTQPPQGWTPRTEPQGIRAPVHKASRRSRHPVRYPVQDSACRLSPSPRSLRDAYQFGGPLTSYMEFAVSHRARSHISLLVWPRASHGLLLLSAPLMPGGPSLALFLSHGHLVAKTEGPRPHFHVKSQGQLQMGRWHKVSLHWTQGHLQLVTDGVRVQRQERPLHQQKGWQGPLPSALFVGGLPPSGHSFQLPVRAIASGFSGCVMKLKWNKQLLEVPVRMRAITPCSPGPLEPGLFFTGSGGVITVDLPEALGPSLDLRLEMRPQAAKGLVFHLGQAQMPPYLQLQVLGKQVLLQGDDGAAKFSTLVTLPAELCDGRWHHLAVTKTEAVTRLEVDSSSNYTRSFAQTTATGLRALHLGGVPGEWSLLLRPPAYHGCLRSLQVNGAPVPITHPVDVQGTVGASGCPLVEHHSPPP